MSKPVTGQTTFGSNTSGTTTQLDNNFLLAYGALNDFNTYGNYLLDSGAADSYVVTLAANLTGAISDGLLVQFKAANTNTGASTLNFNGGGAKSILNIDGSPLQPGQIVAGGIAVVQYDGTQFQLTSTLFGSRASIMVFSTALATIPAGTASYMSTAFTSSGEQALRAPFRGRARNMYANSGTPPGVGETYDYFFRMAGSNSMITSTTIGNASSGSMDTAHAAVFNAADVISISVTVSAGAAVTYHWASIEIEEFP